MRSKERIALPTKRRKRGSRATQSRSSHHLKTLGCRLDSFARGSKPSRSKEADTTKDSTPLPTSSERARATSEPGRRKSAGGMISQCHIVNDLSDVCRTRSAAAKVSCSNGGRRRNAVSQHVGCVARNSPLDTYTARDRRSVEAESPALYQCSSTIWPSAALDCTSHHSGCRTTREALALASRELKTWHKQRRSIS